MRLDGIAAEHRISNGTPLPPIGRSVFVPESWSKVARMTATENTRPDVTVEWQATAFH